MSKLRFYFDFISPYAYLGWPQAQQLAQRAGVGFEPVPVLFAAMLDAYGHKGPAEIEPKRVYTFKHVTRLAQDLGVPLLPPPAHPFNPLLALRVASVVQPTAHQIRTVDALFNLTWREGKGVTDPEAIAHALDVQGLNGAELVAAAGTPEVKTQLRAQTDDALARGVFGVPSVEVESSGEIFWGQDAMGHIEQHLAGNDPVNADWFERFRGLPKGAVRPGSR